MLTIVLVIHLLIAIALVILVLLQPSEGGGIGLGSAGGGGGGGGFGGMMTGRGTANFMTRATAILAACFMVTSVALTMLAGDSGEPRSILDELPAAGAPAVDDQPVSPDEGESPPATPQVPVE